jgi:DNA-binding CsgD family transcriptional regulator/tetratricopeptide (TPR) repeat protein
LGSTRQAHATYYQALVREAGPHLRSPEKGRWLDQLEQELDNLRAVMNGLLAQGEVEQALRLGIDLFWFWIQRNYPREGRAFLERGLAAQGSVARNVRAWALQALGILVTNEGNFARAVELWQTGLVLFQKEGDTLGSAWAHCNIGIAAMYQEEYARAQQLLEESLVLFRELEDQGGGDILPAAGVADGVAHVLHRLAWIANIRGEYTSACALAEESLLRIRAEGDSDRFTISKTTEILATAVLNQGDYAVAQMILAEKLTIEREDGDKGNMSITLSLQGQLALLQGETNRAHALLAESIALLREIASREMAYQQNLAEALSVLGRVVTRQGDLARAQALHEESLAIARNMATTWIIAFSLEGLAETVVAQGKPVWAARLWGTEEFLRETAGMPLPAAWHPDYEHSVAAARAALGEQAFSALWAAGRTLSLEQVLADREPVPFLLPSRAAVPPPASAAGLTPREMDVLRLLAQGLTSAQIAEQLVIGLVTVNSHVRSIYSKLGVTSRSAATRYAIEHHLV